MDSPSPPPSPDYVGAANATAAGNLNAVRYQTNANRINQENPWGNLSYTKNTSFDQAGYDRAMADYNASADPSKALPLQNDYVQENWTQKQTLAPELQAALQQQLAIQQGKSEAAGQMLDSVRSSYATPFSAPSRADYTAGVNPVDQSSVGSIGRFSSGANQNLVFGNTAPPLNTSYDRYSQTAPGQITDVSSFAPTGAQAIDQSARSASQYLGGLQDVNQNASSYLSGVKRVNQQAPTYDPSRASTYAQNAYEAQMALMRPDLERRDTSIRNSLALQGLNPGTEASTNALSSYESARAAQQNALAASSYLTGNEQARADNSQQLADFQAGNAAQQQAFGQGMDVFGANNAARTQALNNRLGVYQGDLAGAAQTNAARNLVFGQEATGFGLNQGAVAQANAARAAQAGQDLSAYGANQSATTAENVARAQQYAQLMQAYQAQNAAANAQFNQDLAGYGANVQGLNTNAALQAARNQAQQQAYQQALGNYGTDWQQAQTLRNMPLNELNSLLTGQQVQTPAFNNYALQSQTSGADLLGATNSQGQWSQG